MFSTFFLVPGALRLGVVIFPFTLIFGRVVEGRDLGFVNSAWEVRREPIL